MLEKMLVLYCSIFLLLISVQVSKAQNSTKASPTNPPQKPPTDDDDDDKACDKDCVLIVIACVLSVFLICLIGSIYYATHQDKGQAKHQHDWNRTMRSGEKRFPPNRQPVNLHDLDNRLNKLGSFETGPYPHPDSPLGANNLGYDFERGYEGPVEGQFDSQNVYPPLKTNMAFLDNNMPPESYQGRMSRLQSAPDMYHTERYDVGPRAFSLDYDRPLGEDEFNPNIGYPSVNYQPGDQFDNRTEYPPYNPDEAQLEDSSLGPRHMSDPMVQNRQPSDLPDQPHEPRIPRRLKPALKHSKSFQEIPIETHRNDFDQILDDQRVVPIRAKLQQRSRSLDVLNQPQNYNQPESEMYSIDQPDYDVDDTNDEEAYDESMYQQDDDVQINIQNEQNTDQIRSNTDQINDDNNNLDIEYRDFNNQEDDIEIKIVNDRDINSLNERDYNHMTDENINKADFHRAKGLMQRVPEPKIYARRLDGY